MAFLSSEIIQGVFSARPSASSGGRLYFSTDTGKIYYDTGTAWVDVTPADDVTSVAGRTGSVVLAESDITGLVSDLSAKAPLASPTFTGTPVAPTPTTSDNSTKLATTAYVQAQGFGTGGGTVTSVALTVPSWLNVGGTPVTTSGTLAVTLASGQTANRFLATPDGTTGAVGLRAIVQSDLPAQPVMLPCSLPGKPGASAIVLIFTATQAITFGGNFSGSYGSVGANPTSTATYTVLKNGSSIGSVAISTSGTFTFTTSSGVSQSLAAGDRLTVTAPTSQDATLSDVGFTLAGLR